MFTFDVNGKSYRMQFAHHQANPTINSRGTTYCLLYDAKVKPNKNTFFTLALATGYAHCSLHDCFNKSTGRKTSMSRMLLQYFPGDKNKALRKEIWNKYFEKAKK